MILMILSTKFEVILQNQIGLLEVNILEYIWIYNVSYDALIIFGADIYYDGYLIAENKIAKLFQTVFTCTTNEMGLIN